VNVCLAPAHPGSSKAVKRLVVMVALCNRAHHYIFMLFLMVALCNQGRPLYFCPVIYLSFLFRRLISAAADWMSTILLHMAWP